jgi:glucose-6-phosphate 1-epimerase
MSTENLFEPVILRSANGAIAKICPYGAHLISWCTADGIERLFLSRQAEFRQGAAIRGGVPIIFPQFADLGPLPKHGFLRTAYWHQIANAKGESLSSATFRWTHDQSSQRLWPYPCIVDYTVALGEESLSLSLSVVNTGTRDFSFTAALHTYLRVEDIQSVSVKGLQGLRYRDTALGGSENIEADSLLTVIGELDRIYLGSTQRVQVLQPHQRTIVCQAEGFTDTVIWNPGPVKSAALSDMEPEGFKRMLCVEAAVIDAPISLRPDAQWIGRQLIKLR